MEGSMWDIGAGTEERSGGGGGGGGGGVRELTHVSPFLTKHSKYLWNFAHKNCYKSL